MIMTLAGIEWETVITGSMEREAVSTIYIQQWKHVAEWIGHWTQDRKVLGSSPTAGHV